MTPPVAATARHVVVQLPDFQLTRTPLLAPGDAAREAPLREAPSRDGASAEPVGRRIRRLFREQGWLDRRRHPRGPWLHIPVLRQIVLSLHAIYCLATIGRKLRRQTGKRLHHQAWDILRLGLQEGIDAQTYYLLELYRPDGKGRAARALTRYETKNGFFTALKRLRPLQGTRRSCLGDKGRFQAHCAAHGIATVPILGTIENGVPSLAAGVSPRALQRDLFIKPRIGKGARDTLMLRHLRRDSGESAYETVPASPAGRQPATLADIAASIRAPSLLQPRLRNHHGIADLATRSLLVVRVITCLDLTGQPVVTHGMLRVLGKLEPEWHDATEYGAPVNLATGRLGAFAGDKLSGALDWHHHHPHTGAAVAGRLLPMWPQIAALACAAHAACADRVLLGWDIALTPDGPLVVEGNAHPDLAFLQRAHRIPIGQSPLGPLLQDHLDRLEGFQRKTLP